jgi:hypothetical protein
MDCFRCYWLNYLNKNLKYGIALASITIFMGVLAAILVVAVDLSLLLNNWLLILGVVAVIDISLIFIAYKKGRIPEKNKL